MGDRPLELWECKDTPTLMLKRLATMLAGMFLFHLTISLVSEGW